MRKYRKMISVLIEFEVIKGRDSKFIKAWEETTKYIYANFNSLGSRLHRSSTGKFIAYAQWPSIEEYESEHKWSFEGISARNRMRETLISEQATVLDILTSEIDLLKSETHS